MLSPAFRSCQARSRELLQCLPTSQCCRAISTNSAIARGLRETSAADRRYAGHKRRPLFRQELAAYDRKHNKELKAERQRERRDALGMRSIYDREAELEEAIKLDEQQTRGHSEHQAESRVEKVQNDKGPIENGPISVPYTTAASQFIYGVSAVQAALIAQRRKCYRLYIHERAIRRAGALRPERNNTTDARTSKKEAVPETLNGLAAKIPKLKVKMVDDSFLPVMDKMSDGRPHNGVVLEASPLPALPVQNLRPSNRTRPWFDFDLDYQRREEARINGTNNRLPYNSHGWRYPFVLFLDGIVDQGNLGAIIRSAYYLGVDAVAVTKRATAPLDAVAIKASSGAAEAMPLFTVSNPLAFLTGSTINGWRVYAADAPPPPVDNFNVTSDHYRRALDPDNTSPLVTYTRPHNSHVMRDHAPLISHPSILMLGSESAGFRQSVRAKANYLVGVRGTRGLEVGVDSLNVSVAAALIMLDMVRKPTKLATDMQDILKKEFMVAQRLQKPENFDDQVKNDELLF